VGTKLDLARAYMDMGDPDGARSILKEVLQEGSVSQKQEASGSSIRCRARTSPRHAAHRGRHRILGNELRRVADSGGPAFGSGRSRGRAVGSGR
ncbi:MAG: hypothetical protein KA756_10450, partial [Steroidobacteraceae bacterium]|nr:hypothetical protein [Steroidobacteraceae bacterium]